MIMAVEVKSLNISIVSVTLKNNSFYAMQIPVPWSYIMEL